MIRKLVRQVTIGVFLGLLLAGCMQQPLSKTPHGEGRNEGLMSDLTPLTGIAACDHYLSTYLACHRATGLYPKRELQSRYEGMRSNLLQSSKDARIRPLLAARCRSLSSHMSETLQGRTCDEKPTPVTGSH